MLLLAVVCSELYADSFRCGRSIIQSGDSPGDLLHDCGEPAYRDSGFETIRLDRGRKKVRVQRWHYKKSSRRFERIVMIYQGRVVAIRTGQR